MFFAYRLYYNVTNNSVKYVYLSQICEWISMIFIIRYQKEMKVEELMYQINNNYGRIQRREGNLKQVFFVFFGVVFMVDFLIIVF